LNPTKCIQPLPEGCEPRLSFWVVLGVASKHSHTPYPVVRLRESGARPKGGCTAQQGDQITSPQCKMAGPCILLLIHGAPVSGNAHLSRPGAETGAWGLQKGYCTSPGE